MGPLLRKTAQQCKDVKISQRPLFFRKAQIQKSIVISYLIIYNHAGVYRICPIFNTKAIYLLGTVHFIFYLVQDHYINTVNKYGSTNSLRAVWSVHGWNPVSLQVKHPSHRAGDRLFEHVPCIHPCYCSFAHIGIQIVTAYPLIFAAFLSTWALASHWFAHILTSTTIVMPVYAATFHICGCWQIPMFTRKPNTMMEHEPGFHAQLCWTDLEKAIAWGSSRCGPYSTYTSWLLTVKVSL